MPPFFVRIYPQNVTKYIHSLFAFTLSGKHGIINGKPTERVNHMNKTVLWLLRGVCVLLIAAAVGLYIWDLSQGKSPTENLPRLIVIAISGVAGLMRLTPKRRPLSFYAGQYPKELGDAFAQAPKLRQKLLEAVRLYNEDKGAQAIRVLKALEPECRTRDDRYAVGVFTAIAQTDLGLTREAVATYEGLIANGAVSGQVYSNLGMCCTSLEDYDKAQESYKQAIALEPQNALAYSNLANMYFRCDEPELAEEYALQALRLNGRQHQASTLLAILYALWGQESSSEMYVKTSVAAGQDEGKIRAAIDYYMREHGLYDTEDE